MSSNHDQDNHSNEAKPVAFRTPLILALVTVLLILLAVSTCDKRHGCCEDKEECVKECEAKHGEHSTTETHATEHATETHETVAEENIAVADSLVNVDTTAVKVEEHAHH